MNKRIKVAVVGQYTFPYTNNLTRYLSVRSDIDLYLITLGGRTEDAIEGSMTTHFIEVRRPSSLWVFAASMSIKPKLAEVDPDIIHVIQINYANAAVSLRDKYPSTLTVVGILAAEYKFYADPRSIAGIYNYIFNNLIGKRNERCVLSKIPNIIAESSHNKSFISKMTNSRIYVVLDGIEFDLIQRMQPDSRKETDAFFVGGLHPGKGIDLLIKGVAIVVKSIPDFRLVIAGKGWQEKELKKLVGDLNLENWVKFVGFITDEEKFQYCKACKFTVVPSRWDFSPITVYEAMACGKPVIASTETPSEILSDGETGLLFESENVEDLASKMLFLLQNEELRERMGKTALERVRECDWSKIAEQTVEVYKEVIADFHQRKAAKRR